MEHFWGLLVQLMGPILYMFTNGFVQCNIMHTALTCSAATSNIQAVFVYTAIYWQYDTAYKAQYTVKLTNAEVTFSGFVAFIV
jgi:hypothetical protein